MSEFTTNELEALKNKLLEKRHELLQMREELQGTALRQSAKSEQTGDLSGTPIHPADISSDAFEQEMNLRQMERDRQLIWEIDTALEKIEAGQYGYCEIDEKPIARRRLEVIPWARFCKDCKEQREQTL